MVGKKEKTKHFHEIRFILLF